MQQRILYATLKIRTVFLELYVVGRSVWASVWAYLPCRANLVQTCTYIKSNCKQPGHIHISNDGRNSISLDYRIIDGKLPPGEFMLQIRSYSVVITFVSGRWCLISIKSLRRQFGKQLYIWIFFLIAITCTGWN